MVGFIVEIWEAVNLKASSGLTMRLMIISRQVTHHISHDQEKTVIVRKPKIRHTDTYTHINIILKVKAMLQQVITNDTRWKTPIEGGQR